MEQVNHKFIKMPKSWFCNTLLNSFKLTLGDFALVDTNLGFDPQFCGQQKIELDDWLHHEEHEDKMKW